MNIVVTRSAARTAVLLFAICSALAAQEGGAAKGTRTDTPSIRTVSLRALRRGPGRPTRPQLRALGGAGDGISPPSNPVSIVRTGAGALGLYAVPGDAVPSDFVTKRGGPQIVNTPMQLIFWGPPGLVW